MKLTLYRMFGEDNRINKASHREVLYSLTGTLRSETSITSPVIEVHLSGTIDLKIINYAYIEEFNRFYFIDDIISVRNEVWEFHFRVDVLQSYYSVINDLPCIVARTSNKEYVSKNLTDSNTPVLPTYEKQLVFGYKLPYIDNIKPYNGESENLVFVVDWVQSYMFGYVEGSNLGNYLSKPSSQLGGNTPFTMKFVLTYDEMRQFASKVVENTEIASYIISIKALPINLLTLPISLSETNMICYIKDKGSGSTKTTVLSSVKYINQGANSKYNNVVLICASQKIKIGKINNDYRDYSPITTFELFLPYYGIYEVKNEDLYYGIYLDAMLNIGEGLLTYGLYRKEATNIIPITTLSVNIGVDIPFSSTNQQEIRRSYNAAALKGGVSSAVSALTLIAGIVLCATGFGSALGGGLIVGGGTGLAGSLSSMYASMNSLADPSAANSGDSQINTGTYLSTTITLYRKTANVTDTPSNISSVLGLPSMKWIEHISDLGSDVILYVYDCHLDGITALKTEKDEIYRLLRSGVIT